MIKEYLVKDFTGYRPDIEFSPQLSVVGEDELWEILSDTYWHKSKAIAVYKIGDCIIDWGPEVAEGGK